MSVSYLSQPFKSDPYVLPLDLNLFAKIGSIKQGQFDAGVKQTQDMVDKFGSLDVLKEEDRKYLNDKITNIVNSVNNLGGVDFSDRNNLVQIENLGRDIYGDNKVLNAVSSTASVRNLVKTYNDYKTNPKLKGYYSPVNEAYDMKYVNQWMQDGEVGSSYSGPSAASPWKDYKTELAKAAEKIKASKGYVLQDNGLYWSKQTGEEVSPDQVIAQAQLLLTPEDRTQMKKDAWYLYSVSSPTAPETLIQKGAAQYQDKINTAAVMHKYYEGQAAANVNDPKAYQHFTLKANEQAAQIETLKAGAQTLVQNLAEKYKNDPEEMMYQVYSDDFFKGLATAYSYNKRDISIIPNQALMFKQRMEQADEFHKDTMYMEQQKLDTMRDIAVIKAAGAVYKKIDPKTGKVTYEPLVLNSTEPDFSDDPESMKVTEQGIVASNQQLELQKDQLHTDMIQKFLYEHPELGIKVSRTEGNSGLGYQFKNERAQKAIEDANGQRGFQMEDLSGLGEQNARTPLAQKMISAGYSDKELNLIRTFYSNYQMAKEGKQGVALAPDFVETVKKAELIDERIRANNEKRNLVRGTIYSQAGLSKAEQQAMDTYTGDSFISNDLIWKVTEKGGMLLPGMLGKVMRFIQTGEYDPEDMPSPTLTNAIKKIRNTFGHDLDKEIQKHYDKVSTRDVYEGRIFNDKQPNTAIQNFVFDKISTKEIQVSGAEKVSPKDITPIKAGMNPDGSWYLKASLQSGSGPDATFETIKVPIDAKNAARLGFYNDPYQNLNYSVNLTGQSGELSVYGSKNLAVSVVIQKKNINDMNDYSSVAKIKYYVTDSKGNKIPDGQGGFRHMLIPVPGTDGMTPSESYRLVEEAVQKAAQQYKIALKQNPKINAYEHYKQFLMNAISEINN